MNSDSVAVRFRLSASQMSFIWPGLDRIVTCCISGPKGKRARYSFQDFLYSLPSDFDRGKYNKELMDMIIELWRRLRPRAKTGGRVQMHAIEIRAAIFAIRVELDWWRYQKHLLRETSAQTKQRFGVDPESLIARKKKAQRVIRALERHMKRANSRLLSEVDRDSYKAFTSAWRRHIRWIRLWRAYFKPAMIRKGPSKRLYQAIINDLQQLAEIAIVEDEFELPDPDELRRVIRLFAISSRRGRQGHYDIQRVLRGGFSAKWLLVDFIKQRLKLKPLQEK